MNKLRRDYILNLIDGEIAKKELSVQLTTDFAKALKDVSVSQSGDRYHSENAAAISHDYLKALKSLRKEIETSSLRTSSVCKPVSFVEIVYENGENAEFYFVKKGAFLPKVMLITKKSPIGAAIYGKRKWDSITYEIDNGGEKKSFSGRIIHIE